MKVSREELELVRPMNNMVLIELDGENDTITFSDGTELKLDTKYAPENHVPVSGKVVGVPEKLFFSKKRIDISMPWEVDMELEIGDVVYMEYHAVLLALGDRLYKTNAHPDPTYFELDGKFYVFIHYQFLYFVLRDNPDQPEQPDLLMLNSYCIAYPIVEEVLKSSSIILMDDVRNKTSTKQATIAYVGKAATGFIDKKYRDVGDLAPGDIVVFNRWSNQRVEYMLHQKLMKRGVEYVVIQRRWIKAKIVDVKC